MPESESESVRHQLLVEMPESESESVRHQLLVGIFCQLVSVCGVGKFFCQLVSVCGVGSKNKWGIALNGKTDTKKR